MAREARDEQSVLALPPHLAGDLEADAALEPHPGGDLEEIVRQLTLADRANKLGTASDVEDDE